VRRFFFVIESSGLFARHRPDGADDRPEQKHPAEKVDVLPGVLRHIYPWFTAHGRVHRGDADRHHTDPYKSAAAAAHEHPQDQQYADRLIQQETFQDKRRI
jgi:hypothetical protein